MGLTVQDLSTLDEVIADFEAAPDLTSRIRSRIPGLVVTRCDESDLGSDVPFRTYSKYQLFLVDGSSHCWTVTPNPGAATALLLARRKEPRS
jgi:hypothetical protein